MHMRLLGPCHYNNHQMTSQRALSLAIILFQRLYLSFFLLWALVKVTCLQGLFLP
jgi:hypothetical protein